MAKAEASVEELVSMDPALLALASYKAFLSQRRIDIAARLNEFLGTKKVEVAGV